MVAREAEGAGGLKEVRPEEINPNPNNPRVHFDEAKMDILLQSITAVGILVPLIVYRSSSDGTLYLLDGERRLKCALKLNLETVPVNQVREPTRLENLLRMFNIHNVRESWELMPTALKLEVIIRELDKKAREKGTSPATTSRQKLAELTGLAPAMVNRCLKLLSFPKEYQDLALKREIPEDFLIEMYPVLSSIKRKFPDMIPEPIQQHGANEIIDKLIEKRRENYIKSPIEFREMVSVLKSGARGVPEEKIRDKTQKLIEDKAYRIKDAYRDVAEAAYETEDIKKESLKLRKLLETLDSNALTRAQKKDLVRILQDTMNLINATIARLQGSQKR